MFFFSRIIFCVSSPLLRVEPSSPLCSRVLEIHLSSALARLCALSENPLKKEIEKKKLFTMKTEHKTKTTRNKRIFEPMKMRMDGEELHLFDSNAQKPSLLFFLLSQCEKLHKTESKTRRKGIFSIILIYAVFFLC